LCLKILTEYGLNSRNHIKTEKRTEIRKLVGLDLDTYRSRYCLFPISGTYKASILNCFPSSLQFILLQLRFQTSWKRRKQNQRADTLNTEV